MSITRQELAILTILLKSKLPNTRNSSLRISSSMLPISIEDKSVIENISEVKNILISLQNKGIITIERMETTNHQKQITLSETKMFDEIEKLNIQYILAQLTDSEYEKLFAKTMNRLRNESSFLLPLTLIQKYLYLIKNHLITTSNIDLDYYNQLLLFPHLKKYNSSITESSVAFTNSILIVLQQYIKYVKNLIDNSDTIFKDTMLFIFLYPFILPFIKKVKKKVYLSVSENLEQLKKEIQIEKEIIGVLELLKEDERKIKAHIGRLNELEKRLKELEKYEERDVYILIPSEDEGETFSADGLLTTLFGSPPPHLANILREFTYMLYSLMLEHLFGKTHASGMGIQEIDLQFVLKELQQEEAILRDDQLLVQVSLTWMNEFCPAMQDSTIDSDGYELELCKNPECFVVYHKKCLGYIRNAGVHSCLVCGKVI